MLKKFDSVLVHLACTAIGNMLWQPASYLVTRDTYLSGIYRWCIALLFHTCDFLGEYGRKNRVSRFSSIFFFFQYYHVALMDFEVSPPDSGRSVTDFCGSDAYEAQLRCPDEVHGDIWIWSTKRVLKPKFN
jgi:hypothetical protein